MYKEEDFIDKACRLSGKDAVTLVVPVWIKERDGVTQIPHDTVHKGEIFRFDEHIFASAEPGPWYEIRDLPWKARPSSRAFDVGKVNLCHASELPKSGWIWAVPRWFHWRKPAVTGRITHYSIPHEEDPLIWPKCPDAWVWVLDVKRIPMTKHDFHIL